MRLEEQTDVCLVSMPFSDIKMPSMALSLMKSCLTDAGISSVIEYEYLQYAHWVGIQQYNRIVMARHDFLIGEMVFAQAAHGGRTLRSLSGYIDWMKTIRLPWGGATPEEIPLAEEQWLNDLETWQRNAEEYIEETAGRILSHHPKIVALASMFQQTNANIALARRIKKEQNPPIVVVGGANCMGDLGAALIEHIESYDYVFIGEADEIFADVCGRLLEDGEIPPEDLPYGMMSRRSPKPKSVMHRVTKDVESLPIPDFDDYFRTLLTLFPDFKEMNIMVEGSRGCWWGRNKPCTFCGLNGPARNYREKTTDRFADEIATLTRKYPEAKICSFTDSILSHSQMKELPAALKARNIHLQFFSEIKSNLREEDIAGLAGAGFAQLQPGLESLQDDVLQIMNKGCRAIRQLETLKNCRAYGVNVAWNLLCGFPGEKEEYFSEMAELLPKVMHFHSPNQFIHIVFHRYGEYTENPEKYGLHLRPARCYDFIYADKDFIRRSAYVFEPVDDNELKLCWNVPKKGEGYRKVSEIVNRWVREQWSGNLQRLDMEATGKAIDIYDMRDIAKHAVYHLDGLCAEIYRSCRTVRQEENLLAEFSGSHGEDEVREALEWLCGENLMLHIGHEYLALAVDMNAKKRVKSGV